MKPSERIIVALDRSERSEILHLADELSGTVGMFKLGLQAFIANGPLLVRELVERGTGVFLDLKLHDIPNTVRHAVEEAASLGAMFLTVHASGGSEMLRAAARVSRSNTKLLAVTALTSLSAEDLDAVGFRGDEQTVVTRLARLAADAGVEGVVASPHEIGAIREACGSRLLIVTPGIRQEAAAADDQKRTMTPRQAIEAGSDYLVIGRAVTGSRDARGAALRIADSISRS